MEAIKEVTRTDFRANMAEMLGIVEGVLSERRMGREKRFELYIFQDAHS